MKRIFWLGAVFSCLAAASAADIAKADMFGGDDILLGELVANAGQQLLQLQQMLSTGQDTLGYIQSINQGINEALSIGETMNKTMSPGVLSNLQNAQAALGSVQQLYGMVPHTPSEPMQQTHDQSVAEAVDLHNQAYRYADGIDPQAEAIKEQSHVVSPQGAGRLTAESVGVLIHVTDQVLRTNAAMLKVQGEQLALQNRHDKLSSEQFLVQYGALASAFQTLKSDYDLPSLSP